jgi:pyruvate dehydrogenase E2 component (dihydrolipoamide acetyltransferase)
MPVEVRLSQFGMGMQDGRILQWYVAEGEAVAEGQRICEVEAAKTVVDIEAPISGVLARIVVRAEEIAQVRDVIAIIEDRPSNTSSVDAGAIPVPNAERTEPIAASSVGTNALPLPPLKTQIEPRARRRAAELGIDLTLIRGTGPGGRILEVDVGRAGANRGVLAGATTVRGFEDVPVTPLRRTIARRLTEAKQNIPHFYVKVACRAERLLELRRRVNDAGGERKITINDMIVKAAALALRRVPGANASWRESVIRYHRCVDLAIAVATPTGLYAPIIRDADQKSLMEIAAESASLIASARTGSLRLEQYEEGTFTVSNLGMYGVDEFAAIINPPQAAILAVGAAKRQPVIVGDSVEAGTAFTAILSADHRIVDGATAGRLMQAFQHIAEMAALEPA